MLPIDFVNDIPGSTTLLSTIQKSFLPFFTTRDACNLRLVSKEFNDTIKEYHWNDTETPIKGNLLDWRSCFPNAVAANILNNINISDEEFEHLQGIHTLDMTNCKQITDAAFVHLRGIHTFYMAKCNQITDEAFVHLHGIHTLYMYDCNQITDAAFVHLRGIHTLYINGFHQITDAAFVHLRGIHTLNIKWCDQITDVAKNILRQNGTILD